LKIYVFLADNIMSPLKKTNRFIEFKEITIVCSGNHTKLSAFAQKIDLLLPRRALRAEFGNKKTVLN
jgi:hypothetical protein